MALEPSEQDKMTNCYESLLLRYAAGSLDMAQNLVVEAHLTFSPYARDFVSSCECMGGALMENECSDVRMRQNSLDKVLAQLDTPHPSTKPCCSDFECDTMNFQIPEPLKAELSKNNHTGWSTAIPGFDTLDLKLACKKSSARFVKFAPGFKTPHHKHQTTEITLILDGAFSDENGSYKQGDLIVTDETVEHAPTACRDLGCTCMVVSSKAIKLTGIASLLNPFLKP